MISVNKENPYIRLENIKVISFDAGFTLLEINPSFGAILARIAASHGFECDAEILDNKVYCTHHKLLQVSRNQGKGMYACEKNSKYWWDQIAIHSYPNVISLEEKQHFADHFYEDLSQSNSWQLYPDTISTLSSLKEKGYKLVVLSNWDSRLIGLLKSFSIIEYFDNVYYSTLIGHEKPDIEFYEYAINDLNVFGKNILHIGDNVIDDFHGARQANIQSLVIEREITVGLKNYQTIEAANKISSLNELIMMFHAERTSKPCQ